MTDVEYAFNADVAAKKSISRGAQHKKTHNGKGGCKLPSDYLTTAQKAKLNGEVVSYRLTEPMTNEKLITLPEPAQALYLGHLIKTYSASLGMLADMLGISRTGVHCKLQKLNLTLVSRPGRPSKAKAAAWQEFLCGVDAIAEDLAPDLKDVPEEPEATAETTDSRPTASWEDLFLAAKLVGERYGVKVQVVVG